MKMSYFFSWATCAFYHNVFLHTMFCIPFDPTAAVVFPSHPKLDYTPSEEMVDFHNDFALFMLDRRNIGTLQLLLLVQFIPLKRQKVRHYPAAG